MRKPLHTLRFSLGNRINPCLKGLSATFQSLFMITFLVFASVVLNAQCNTSSGIIEGTLFNDLDIDGEYDVDEVGTNMGSLSLYNMDGQFLSNQVPSGNGYYQFSGLDDGETYTIVLEVADHLSSTLKGSDHTSDVVQVGAPACQLYFGITNPVNFCDDVNPSIAVTCFVKGPNSVNDGMETVVSTQFSFNKQSSVQKIATKGETGSVFGSAWSSFNQTLYTSTFVKQDAFIGNKLGSIYASHLDQGVFQTSHWISLEDLGIDVGTLAIADAENCDYGGQVGKVGIGGLEISPDEKTLLAVNLYKKSIVIIDLLNPQSNTTMEVPINAAPCVNGEMRPFAIKYFSGKYYVSTTCDASSSQQKLDHYISVLEFDLTNKTFSEILNTSFTREYWQDADPADNNVAHWLTDIEFTNDGNMVLGIADRTSHRYCHKNLSMVNQFPDILIAWNDNGIWKLESNGKIGNLSGSGVNNGQGPGGGEFFGEDFWILGPLYHPEIATGTVFSLPGVDEIIATVFDPIYNTFTGGFHRYSTKNGSKLSAIELYKSSNQATFGKGSGLGNIIDMCGPAPIQIGNYVWFDENENGNQEASELPVEGLIISLMNENCEEIASTTTSSEGEYYFDQDLKYHAKYYVVITDPRMNVLTGIMKIGNEDYELTVSNLGNPQINSKAEVKQGVCDALNGLWAIEVITSGPGYVNHNFDLGLVSEPVIILPKDTFDLALIKKVNVNGPVKLGQLVEYEITIFNQGNVTAKNIEIVDYMPTGLSFPFILNPGWGMIDGNPRFTLTEDLAPGSERTMTFTMQVEKAVNMDGYINYAEIVSAEDENGMQGDDIDSHADNVIDNDNGGEPGSPNDDQYKDDGTVDEDDHDPATLDIFDLALIKTTNFDQTVRPGDNITYEITIVNQGNVVATEIEITDYLPVGFELSPLDNNQWIQQGQNLTKIISEELLPGNQNVVELILVVTLDAGAGNLINIAEISGVKGPGGDVFDALDFDSSPDAISDNDNGGIANSSTDNIFDGDGTLDEDDHDPARLFVFDLALRKVVDNPTVTNPDQEVVYTFTVYNQGEVAAKEIDIVDHLPDGLLFDPALNVEWQLDNTNHLSYSFTNVLDVGQEVSVDLILFVDENFFDQDLVNYGEISNAIDINDVNSKDFDSVSDDDNTNDNGGVVNTSSDDQIDGNGTLDEDDHDPAVIHAIMEAQMHDISLTKRGKEHHSIEDTIVFELIAYNQGEYTIGEITIVDYLPFFLISVSPEWENDAMGIIRMLNVNNGGLPQNGLLPGDSVSVELKVVVDQNAFPGFILNTAEIGSVFTTDGIDLSSKDVDSKADFDPRNDVSDNLKEQQGGAGPGSLPVEDDRAAFEIFISKIERTKTCECLDNDSGAFDGQFEDRIVVTSGSDETWYIELALDFYSPLSPNPPAAPIPFVTGPGGFLLNEKVIEPGISEYSLEGVFYEGVSYFVILKNVEEEIALSINGGQECRYNRLGIQGPVNACIGSIKRYSVINSTPGGIYDWNVDLVGGVIVGPSNREIVRVQWNAAAGGPYLLSVDEVSPDDCVAPTSIGVSLGDEFAFSISCIQDIQVSLDNNCEVLVTPQIMLAGGPYDYASYDIELADEHGHPITGAMLDYSHVDKRIMVTVTNSCTGNSCWSWLTVEDKIPPFVKCYNDTIRCISIGQYAYPSAIDACDPAPVITMVNEILEPLDCNELYIKRVTRMFVAEDASGNISDTCTQIIMLERIVLKDIVYPDSFTIANGNALECKSFPTDSLGFPFPDSFGVPTYQGIPIYPLDYYCNVGVDYKDTELPQVGCVRKIIREWRIFEWWCTQEIDIISYPQYFEIRDTVPPKIECPQPHYVITNTSSCDADVFIDDPVVNEKCGSVIRVDLIYPGGFIENFTAREITLPVDTNMLRFRVYDECYNVDSCDFMVLVEDNTPPVAICDQFTTVGLTDTGYAYIYARTFDDLSYDNCTLKKMEVKRVDDGANCGIKADTFGPYVEFCCNDVGQNVMVIFRITDKSGNQNSCMVQVEVQDKIPPKMYCPPNDTINCEFHYDTTDLSMFGEPVVLDNCDYELTEHIFLEVDQCREGYIERVWVAKDGNNFATCSQRIYIINDSPFDSTDITWPKDFDTTECRNGFLTPDLLSAPYDFPVVDEDFCDLVGITYTDHRFSFTQNTVACYKILRKWEIVNWCRFDTSIYDVWTHEQVIKVHNEIAPVIQSSCDTINKCIFDDCELGYIELKARATDDCTDTIELRWEFHIDLDNNGTVDYSNVGQGNKIDASRTLKLGSHNIRYVFEDKCGNRTVCTQFFNIYNCKPPTAYCKNGLIVDLIPMDLDGDGNCDNEMIEIWAVDLNDFSTSLCDYPLIYSFGRDTTNKRKVLDCENLGRNELEICVTDPRGLVSCCSTFVIVQDNNMMDCCPTIINKNCVIGPADVNLSDCNASTDPDDLMSRPNTARCDVDSIDVTYRDEDGTTGDNCVKIKRIWSVTLYLGGRDTLCEYTHCITIDNDFSIDSIVWPADTIELVGCNNSLDTSNTGGVPRLIGEYCDFVNISNSDEQVEGEDSVCTYFARTWTITNECDNDKEYVFEQLIIFHNQLPPDLTVPADITLNAEDVICRGFANLTAATHTDCSSGVSIENDFNSGGDDASGFYSLGKTTVTFTATDICGNVATGETMVTVIDITPPRLTCPQDINLECDVDLDTVDFGQHQISDNCSAVTLTIDTFYSINVCNIGTITRRFVARDTSNNVISCNQRITISNPNPFTEDRITWPDDTVRVGACESTDADSTGRPIIDLTGLLCSRISVGMKDTFFMDTCDGSPCNVIERKWTVIDSCQLDNQGGGIFCFTQRIEIVGSLFMITCPSDTTIFCEDGIGDLSQYGDVAVTSDCGIDTIIRDSSSALNICEVGTITRTFFVRDTLGNEMRCEQLITIEIRDPFVEGRITWPQDTVEIGECEIFDTDRTGEPVIDTSGLSCFKIEVTFEDTMFMGTCDGEPCDIIERTWTVVDSCQLDGMGGGIFTFLQRIEITGGSLSASCPSDTTVSCGSDLSDLSIFGELTVSTDCGIDTIIRDSTIDLNDCNMGTITRTLFVRDTLGNEVMCSQVITVESPNPFDSSSIIFPMDTILLDECTSSHPDSINSRPILDTVNTVCYNITVSYSDSSTSNCMSSPCLVITRDWTIVDSCQLDSRGNGIWTFRQRIEVNDTTAPEYIGFLDTTFYVGPDSCSLTIDSLIGDFTDCSDVLTITNNSPFADSNGNNAGGNYPVGEHEFFFIAEDGCCNKDSQLVKVTVLDTIAPTITCEKTFKTMFDTIVGVKFTAKESVVNIIDNCGLDFTDYTISYSKDDPGDTCRVYDCDTLRGPPRNENLNYTVTIYVTDENGNVDSCDAILQIIDMAECFTRSLVNVIGQIQTNNLKNVIEANVNLKGAQSFKTVTGNLGEYSFNDMSTGGVYDLVPYKNDKPLEGVTTKDLILIQRFLLGISSFDSPYSHIAADINKSDEVTSGDIIMLRRMLLGYYSEFPTNTSWRFVDEAYVFPDPLDPWFEKYPETYEIKPLTQTMFIDFVGVKTGDVSGNAGGLDSPIQARNDNNMTLVVKEEDGWIHIIKPEGEGYLGAQFTLEFVSGDERFEVSYTQESPLRNEHFGYHSLDKGLLTIVLDRAIQEEEVTLFSIPIGAVKTILRVSSKITNALALREDLSEVGVVLEGLNQIQNEGYSLYQNRPNPFDKGTVIGFELPTDQSASLSVMNMSGQLVHFVEGDFVKGYNEIEIEAKILGHSGVYYYRLDCGGYSQTLKMINIE